jgi:hypothetical protein
MTLIATNPTLADISRASLPDGSLDRQMVDTISETNQVFLEATVLEGNSPVGNITTQITSEPTVEFRALNEGVSTSKGTTKQVMQTAGMVEGNNQVDEKMVKLNGNKESYLALQDLLFSRAMPKKLVNEIFYGNQAVDPKGFDGLATFYSAISTDTTKAGYNIISCGGSSADNYSMWLVVWDPTTLHLFYPQGLAAGWERNYQGVVRVLDANGKPYMAHCTNFSWSMGLAVKDHRYAVRLANIDASDLITYGSSSDTSPDLLGYMTKAIYRVPTMEIGRPVFYANNTVLEHLEKMIDDKATSVRVEDIMMPGGKKMRTLFYKGIPIRRVDKLALETTAIS